ncbi:MAG: hypothetical protein CHACPFDD_02754 [Phycisphaerae bacterium]|nr:hypothetical protein [Phycisphaerae bacterium]
MIDFDLFDLFRTMLFVAVGVYTALVALSAFAALSRVLAPVDAQRRLLRRYVTYHLLAIRWSRQRGELLQIGALLAALGFLSWAHRWIP